MLALVFALAVAADAPPDLSPDAQALVTSVQTSIEQVRVRQAALPPAKDDSERIMRLHDVDQAPRKVIVAYDFSKLPDAQRAMALARVSALVDAVDREDNAELMKLLPPEGWFLKSKYGNAAWAAFDIVQHGGDAVRERFLPVLGPLVASGEVPGQAYAMMYDRVQTGHKRPQRYGTQFRCDGGKWRPYPVEDPDDVDARRKTFGIEGTFAEVKAYYAAEPPCPQTQSPPPPGMKLD